MLKPKVYILLYVLSLSLIAACGDNTNIKIRESLTSHYKNYAAKNNKALTSLLIDSITYILTDSTAYYNHFLNLLDQRSESYSKMARLRTSLAKAQMDSFLTANKNENYLRERNKLELDKSLEALKNNEREWDMVNDSMDLLLNAIHTTDSSKKVFYKVSYSLKADFGEEIFLLRTTGAILNRGDFKVVFAK